MSRIGKQPIAISNDVHPSFQDGVLTVKGKLGQLQLKIPDAIKYEFSDGCITVKPSSDSKKVMSLWGTTQKNIRNIVDGVTSGFEKSLEVNGVGYKAALKGKDLLLNLGFSHEVLFSIPDDISVKCPKPTLVTISGIDRQKVSQIAAEIRSIRKPEPYKGKGVKYVDERILRKEGKKK